MLRSGLGRRLHQTLERICFSKGLGCATEHLLVHQHALLAASLCVLARSSRRGGLQIALFFLRAFLLLPLHIDLLHLRLLINLLIITAFLTIALLEQMLLLLLLLEEQDLLNLLLSQLLVDHFLLSREIVFLDLLTTTLDVQLVIFMMLVIHDLVIVILLLLCLLIVSPAQQLNKSVNTKVADKHTYCISIS